DAGDSGVGEDVGVALHDLVGGERPKLLRRAGVVVVDERDGLLWQPPDHAGGLAVAVAQPPQLALDARLQEALGGEVERHRRPADGVHPVHQLLPALVLVGRRLAVAVVAQRVPYLGDDEARLAALDVHLSDVRGVSLGEVEAPAVEADVGLEPVEPVGELPLDARVEVVDVGRRAEPLAGVAVARAVGVLRVVAADHAGAPVEAVVGRPALEHAVHAAGVLLLGAPVVDHDVGDALDALPVERRDQRLELRRRAVLGRVQVVETPRHVPLRRHGVRRRRQPDVGDPGLGDVVDLAFQHVVPATLLLPRLPVETLHDACYK
ncbi:Os08g0473800, partial [Oryza sativa Japonica Group]